MLASAHFPHEELVGKTTAEKHEMLHSKQVNWAKEPADFKRGRVVRPQTGRGWGVDLEIPIFNRHPDYLDALIPAAE
jgi:tRNA(His) 5'-end guanylyltransferase